MKLVDVLSKMNDKWDTVYLVEKRHGAEFVTKQHVNALLESKNELLDTEVCGLEIANDGFLIVILRVEE